jgi:hypothetical protein
VAEKRERPGFVDPGFNDSGIRRLAIRGSGIRDQRAVIENWFQNQSRAEIAEVAEKNRYGEAFLSPWPGVGPAR